jgi:hypothetical protein
VAGQRLDNIEKALAPPPPKITAIVDRPSSPGQAHELHLTDSQSADFAKSLVASGVSADLVAKALAEEGYPALVGEVRSAQEVEYDDTFGAVKPEAFRVDLGRREVDLETASAFQNEAGAAMSQIGFPQSLASAFVLTSLDHHDELKAMTPDQRAVWAGEQETALDSYAVRHGIKEGAKGMKQIAAALLAKTNPEWLKAANSLGALNSTDLVVMLYLQGERTLARDEMLQARPKKK